MIILAKKSDETIVILSIVTVIAVSALFAILTTQYSLLSITGLAEGTIQGTVLEGLGFEIVTITSTPAGACDYNNVQFGILNGGAIRDTTGFTSAVVCTDPRPIIVRNIGEEIADIVISGDRFWTSADAAAEDFQFKIGIPSISDDSSLDACSPTPCFVSAITAWTNLPTCSTDGCTCTAPICTPAQAINNLNYQDTNDEARVDIKIHVPINQQGLVDSTVTITASNQLSF